MLIVMNNKIWWPWLLWWRLALPCVSYFYYYPKFNYESSSENYLRTIVIITGDQVEAHFEPCFWPYGSKCGIYF